MTSAEGFLPDVLRLDLGWAGDLMSGARVDACLALLAESDVTVVDLHGPPPERHPRFRELVILVRALRRRLIHRCDPALLAESPDLPELLAEHRVDLVAGLPAGGTASRATLRGLRRLNAAGYGVPGTGLVLDLAAPFAPAGHPAVVAADTEGVRFTRLHLVASGDRPIEAAVHPARILGVPCRFAVCVDWDGRVTTRELGEDGGEWLLATDVRELRSLECVPAAAVVGAALEEWAASL